MGITHAGIIWEDNEAPRYVLLAEVERFRALERSEGQRIRRELLREVMDMSLPVADCPDSREEVVLRSELLASLDHIVPEEE